MLAAAQVKAFDAQVGWSPVQSVAGYRVYVRQVGQSYAGGTDVGLLQPSGGVVQYTARGLPSGIVNYVAVTAYDGSGRESGLSNELSVSVTTTPAATATRSATATATRTGAAATATRTGAATATPTAVFTAPRTATSGPAATPTSNTRTATPIPTATTAPGTTTIWGPGAVPGTAAIADASAIELGVKFTSDTNGVIRGIRFYKSAANTGTHAGSLWNSSGQRLAAATFAGESASGWQQVNFASPVAISAGAVYVASYHTDVGYYAGDVNYFAAAGVDRPPLHALRNGTSGGNGVYAYGPSTFPANTFLASNYWVDVVFSAAAPPPATSTMTPAAAATRTVTRTPAPTGVQTSTPSPTPTPTSIPPTAALTIWASGTVPANAAAADTAPVELGVKFTSDVNGVIRGIRFYKGAGNGGTHSGSLWTSGGQRLRSATFSGETASGWQQVYFASPVAISAGVVYVASYHTDVGRYAGDNNYFAAAGVDRAPLHALRNGASGGNGVYVYGPSAFPANSYQASNYWVDVIFSPTP